MGVNDLWQILEPVKQHVHLHSLSGKTIAVDLSLWVCEAQTVKKMIGTVMKPHLRNLFFRISYLTLMDVKLVFVMEGEPPHLKADVISKRNQVRYGPSGKTWSQKTGRSHFKSVLKECLDMLECLGIPWVQAAGEAEAMCAYLSASGYVDGCLTNDGDAFLYGAQTVYRNFTMNTKVTARQAPLSMGFSLQEHWSRLPFSSPGDLPNPGIGPASPALQGGILYHNAWYTAIAK